MKDKIIAILNEYNPEIITFTGDSILKSGLIDSFELISIIEELEEEFDFEIDAEFVTDENFGTMDKIVQLVENLLGGQA